MLILTHRKSAKRGNREKIIASLVYDIILQTSSMKLLAWFECDPL